ncbi:MAG: hypothetical protein IJG51_10215, partial [Synergistaceae bacterium]|nr:hypothetical protein [Synergistaceae bacterium]
RCWDKFAEIWRPVLRNDPYKLEEAKYRIQRLAGNAEVNREEIRRLLGVIQDNTTAGDWSNNLFAGVVYFLLGDKDEGIACVETNVDFGYETDISGKIIAQMKQGDMTALALYALKEDITISVKPQQEDSAKPTHRRELTRAEIEYITLKRGFNLGGYFLNPRGTEIYTSHHYEIKINSSPTVVFCCADGIYIALGMSEEAAFLISYSELRDSPDITTPSSIAKRAEPVKIDKEQLVALWELRLAE